MIAPQGERIRRKMWEEILKTALESGLWAVLFCVLLLYQLRDGRTREEKYRQTIDALVCRLSVLDSVSAGMEEALKLLRRRDKRKTEEKENACAATEVQRV